LNDGDEKIETYNESCAHRSERDFGGCRRKKRRRTYEPVVGKNMSAGHIMGGAWRNVSIYEPYIKLKKQNELNPLQTQNGDKHTVELGKKEGCGASSRITTNTQEKREASGEDVCLTLCLVPENGEKGKSRGGPRVGASYSQRQPGCDGTREKTAGGGARSRATRVGVRLPKRSNKAEKR